MMQADLIAVIITVLIVTYKTVLYMRHFPNKGIFRWLFFGRTEIMLSSTPDRRTAKAVQNILSIVSLIGMILSLGMYLLTA